MTRYLISDLHLEHANIIDYCDRPFTDVEEMNEALVDNWNQTVDEDDEVIFVGDLALTRGEDQVCEWIARLNGRLVFIRGNHDSLRDGIDGLGAHEWYVLSHGDWRFLCTHWPEKVPQDWDGWVVHGHHHDNHPDQFPFIDPENQRVNVSVELLEYTPLNIDLLTNYIDLDKRFADVNDARQAWEDHKK
ncbi:metallophosphoesterase [Salinigranum halophilum]|uniref:metallophosphoesterase n=1 Tax=Salinigranum halophilum TaxID=2565931 RepID=UPI001375FCBC|nr:metallophosphoesterase [Salinigranum halophilum]